MKSPVALFQHFPPALQVLALLALSAWLRRAGFGAGYVMFLLAVGLGFASGGDLETVADMLSRGANSPETFLWLGVLWCLAGGAQMARLARRFRPASAGGTWGRALGTLLAPRTPPSFASARLLPVPRFLSQAAATALPVGAPFVIASALLDGRVPFRETCLVLGACGGLTAWCGLLLARGGAPGTPAGRLLPQACAILPVLALWRWGPAGLLAGAGVGLIASWISSGAGFGRGGRILRRMPLADLALGVIGARVLLEALRAASLDGVLLRPDSPSISLAASATVLPFLLGVLLREANLALPLALALLPASGDARTATLLAAACWATAGTLCGTGGPEERRGLAAPLALGVLGSGLLTLRLWGS